MLTCAVLITPPITFFRPCFWLLCLLVAVPLVAKADDAQAPSISSDGPCLALVGSVITLNEVDILSELALLRDGVVAASQRRID